MKKSDNKLNYRVEGFDTVKILSSLLLVVVLGLVVILVSVMGIDKKETTYIDLDTKINIPDVGGGGAFLAIESNSLSEYKVGDYYFDVVIDTNKEKINGSDIVLKYDDKTVDIKKISYGDVFDDYKIKKEDGGLRISSWFRDLTKTFEGKGNVVTVFYTPKKFAKVDFVFVCEKGNKGDTNISSFGRDVVDCEKNQDYFEDLSSFNTAEFLVLNESYYQESTSNLSAGGSIVAPSDLAVGFTTAGCDYKSPSRPTNLKAVTGVNEGEVVLTWDKVENATHYTVSYGERWLDFDYGSSNIGDTDRYIVSGLEKGVAYYFVVTAVNQCASSGYSDGAAAYAGGSVVKTEDVVVNEGGYDWEYEEVVPDKGYSPSGEMESDTSDEKVVDNDFEQISEEESQSEKDASIIYDPEDVDDETGMMSVLMKYLPWIGLGLLLVLGVMMVIIGRGNVRNGSINNAEINNYNQELVKNDINATEDKVRNYFPQDSSDQENVTSEKDGVEFPKGFENEKYN